MIEKNKPLDWLDYEFIIITKHKETEATLLATYVHASLHSPDPSTQLGALIIANKNTLLGVNGISRGLEPTHEQLMDRGTKYLALNHAERHAIYSAASSGLSTKGTTMVCPWYSCPDCAKAIVGANIKKVVGHLQMFRLTPDRWKPAINAGMKILAAGDVEMCLFDGPVGGADDVSVRFGGEMFWPGRCLDIVTK